MIHKHKVNYRERINKYIWFQKILTLALQKYKTEVLDKKVWVNKYTWVKNYLFSENCLKTLEFLLCALLSNFRVLWETLKLGLISSSWPGCLRTANPLVPSGSKSTLSYSWSWRHFHALSLLHLSNYPSLANGNLLQLHYCLLLIICYLFCLRHGNVILWKNETPVCCR